MKYIKKKFLIFICILFTGCITAPKKTPWITATELSNNWKGNVEIGDIIVKNKTLNPMEWYGHVGVVVTPYSVADYPKILIGYQESIYYYWLNEDRNVVVLRYKYFTETFKKQFLKNVSELKNQKYWVSFDKTADEYTYCSKYIWYLYWKTAKDLGYNLNIDRDGGFLVMPYDLLNSPELKYTPINFLKK